MDWTWLCPFALPMLVNGDVHSPDGEGLRNTDVIVSLV